MSFPTATLDTPNGKIIVTATDANHVAVRGGYEQREGIGPDEHFIVNGVRYHLHAHLCRYEDAVRPFQPQRHYYGQGAGSTVSDRFHEHRSISLRRTDTYKDGSDAAIRKTRSVLVEAVNKFLASKEGLDLLTVAENDDENRRLETAENKLYLAQQAVAEAQKELNEVRASIGLDTEDFS